MPKNTIDVKAGRLFPFHFLILGGVLLLAGGVLVINNPITGGILILLAVLILTAYEGTEINPYFRTYREYNSFLFFRSGKPLKYASLEGIFIHRAKISQKMFTPRTMRSSTFTHMEYRAYLKIGNEKILLLKDKNKMRLLEQARKIADSLNTSVADHALFP